MRFKFIIVLTIVLSAFLVLPVNADNSWIISKSPNEENLGNNPTYQTLSVTLLQDDYINVEQAGIYILKNGEYDLNTSEFFDYHFTYNHYTQNGKYYSDYVIDLQSLLNYDDGSYTIYARFWLYDEPYFMNLNLWNYNIGNPPINDFDIDIDLQEQTLELGTINDLDQSFDIGSSSDRIVKAYTYQSSQNCIIFDLQRNFVNVQFNKNNNQALIYLTGTAQKDEDVTDFVTTVHFNYTFEEKEKIDFEIESIDYDKGLQLIGTNLTVYYYHELDDMIEQVYHNNYANGLEHIELLNNTDIFIEFHLNGYNAVNGQNFDYLNNKYGILTNTKFKSTRLYFTKIDPSVLLFQGFIIKDSLGNALSGVSVTMDNNQTVISNNYGGVRFDNINQGQHTFTFTKTGYYSQSLTKTVSVSNTQNILLVSSQPTTAPTIKPTPIQTDSEGNIIIDKPSNLSDSIKYGLAKMFGIESLNNINLIFAMLIILFCAVIGGVITNQSLGFISGGLIGFVFGLAVGLIPIWVFFAMVMLSVIYLVFTTGSKEGF